MYIAGDVFFVVFEGFGGGDGDGRIELVVTGGDGVVHVVKGGVGSAGQVELAAVADEGLPGAVGCRMDFTLPVFD